MNCKQGDIARVVPLLDYEEWARGLIVRCVRPYLGRGEPAWFIEPELRMPDGTIVAGMDDCILRPIRDPGEDAVDESHAWLPPVPDADDVWKPKRQVEHA